VRWHSAAVDASAVSLPDLALPFAREALRRRLVTAATEHGAPALFFFLVRPWTASALLCTSHAALDVYEGQCRMGSSRGRACSDGMTGMR
jgi:hypothetical protein